MRDGSDDPTIPSTHPHDGNQAAAEHPDRIGPYRILQVLGEGAMGIVYDAEQLEPVRRRVAIKLLKLGMDTKEFVARFEAERQALAVMDHPNIARVHDAGATETGRPYFVMEKVAGVPITHFCDSEKLGTPARLELFIPVCKAVQHAHQKGVIHRDIKPTNILVAYHDGKPVPKIIDFGVAKAVNWRLSEHTVLTQVGQPIGTPAYMSPEQWGTSRLDVDTRTDVYSLGVVLFELLVGRLPVDPNKLDQAGPAAGFVLHETPPPTPSRRVLQLRKSREVVAALRGTDPASLGRELEGDLDWIVTKAMDPDRTRRYETANGLASDIRRHLTNQPVVARPPSVSYRLGKFVQRHRAGVAASVIVGLLIVGFAIVMAVQANLISDERDRARFEADKAEQVATFLTELFEVSDPGVSLGSDLTAREILDRGAERIRSDLVDQPDLQIELMSLMGDVYVNLGLYDESTALVDSWLDVATRTYGTPHSTIADALSSKATLMRLRGELTASEALYRDALAMRRTLFGDRHPDVAHSLNGLGLILDRLGQYDEAARLLNEALVMRREFFDPVSEPVAQTVNNLAGVVDNLGDLDSAEVLLRESLALRRELYGDEHPAVATALNNLGLLLRTRRDLDGAEPLLREALALRRKILGDEHPAIATALNNLAGVMRMKGDLAAAEPLYFESLALRRTLYGDTHPAVATALNNLGRFFESKEDDATAERYLRESLDVARAVYPPNHRNLGASLRNLGNVMSRRGNLAGAEPVLRESLAIFRNGMGPTHIRTIQAQSDLGGCLAALGRYDEAETLLVESYQMLAEQDRVETADGRRAGQRLVALYEAWGKPDAADRYRPG